jgi:hypothetical protein
MHTRFLSLYGKMPVFSSAREMPPSHNWKHLISTILQILYRNGHRDYGHCSGYCLQQMHKLTNVGIGNRKDMGKVKVDELNGVTEVIRCLANHKINCVICPNNRFHKDNFEPYTRVVGRSGDEACRCFASLSIASLRFLSLPAYQKIT